MNSLIGLFGGTFDPIHKGHLLPALDVMNALKLDQIRFIPNRTPPHRTQPWLSVEQRKNLLDVALQDYPNFVLDERELNREGESFMVDTLTSLNNDFPDKNLCLIIGMDAMIGLRDWYKWPEILEKCHLIVTQRPGFSWQDIPDNAEFEALVTDDVELLKHEASGRILLQSVTQVDISASQIRQLIHQGKEVKQIMPEKVLKRLFEIIENTNIEKENEDRQN